MVPSCKQSADPGHVGETALNRSNGVELSFAERDAVGDWNGLRPGDGWRCLGYGEGHGGLRRGVVRGVGRRENRGEPVRSRREYVTGRRQISK